MNLDNFHNLDGSVIANENNFGSKIHILSRLLQSSIPIPKGYYFTLNPSTIFIDDGLTPESENLLKFYHERLVNEAASKKCIVRSSSSVEDNPDHQFSGLFESRKNILTFDELLDAIRSCFASKNTNRIRNYASNFGINVNDIRLAILVQQQIEPSISGLAHLEYQRQNRSNPSTDYLEIIDGDMERLIAGETNPIAFELNNVHGTKPFLAPRSDLDKTRASTLNPHLNELTQCFQQIKNTLKQSVLVEFCIEQGNGLSVFQARPYQLVGGDPIRIPRETSIPVRIIEKQKAKILKNEDKWGLKGAAMVAFKQMKLFHPPLLCFEPLTPLYVIKDKLEQLPSWEAGLTIRYSKGDEIGLPRIFVENHDEAYLRIAEAYEPNKDYFIIVHGYLNVTRSYELIIDKDYIVLEHIPGLWEANNTLEPDVMILDGTKSSLLKVKERRQKLIVGPRSTQHIFEDPQDDEFFRKRFSDIVKISNTILKPKFINNLPLNVHFVETDEHQYNFLNIRRIARLNKKYVRGGSFFHVRKREDLFGWDGKTPILLRISTQRGKEVELIGLAGELPKGNVEVFATFGYLSHPAIILREFGVNIVPAYFNREVKEIQI